MKTFKIIALTVIISGGIFIAGSAYGAFQVNVKDSSKSGIVIPQKTTTAACPSVSDQIAKGYKYDICTGAKLPANFSADTVDARLEAIEARLKALEDKNK